MNIPVDPLRLGVYRRSNNSPLLGSETLSPDKPMALSLAPTRKGVGRSARSTADRPVPCGRGARELSLAGAEDEAALFGGGVADSVA